MEFRISACPTVAKLSSTWQAWERVKTRPRRTPWRTLTLTTFHVVYKSFMNPSDPHQSIEDVDRGQGTQAGRGRPLHERRQDRPFASPEWPARADTGGHQPPASFRSAHRIKIVYGQDNGKTTLVSATLDNAEDEALTSAIGDLNWPKCDKAYVVKQFIVVNWPDG